MGWGVMHKILQNRREVREERYSCKEESYAKMPSEVSKRAKDTYK